jgi:hypothetical protein
MSHSRFAMMALIMVSMRHQPQVVAVFRIVRDMGLIAAMAYSKKLMANNAMTEQITVLREMDVQRVVS